MADAEVEVEAAVERASGATGAEFAAPSSDLQRRARAARAAAESRA